jgi:hypothetical protein
MTDPLLRADPLRLRHGRGEALRGRDFADQSDQDDQRRWWHNRAVHQAYGILRGLEVTVDDGVATVAPGVAFDCHGRELVLATPRQVVVPADAETSVLVIARRGGDVTVCWSPREAAARSGDVRLDLVGHPAPALARPFARPRIGRGATIPGSTAWEPWSETFGAQTLHLGIQVDVDTSAAGFTATPCYLAQVRGATWDARLALALLVPFDHLARQQRDRFTFRLLMPWLYVHQAISAPELAAPDYREAFRGLAQITDLAVTWIGIQGRTEGEP